MVTSLTQRGALIVAIVTLFVGSADAHHGRVVRRVLLEQGPQQQRLHVVFHFEATGHRRRMFLSLVDQDRNGRLSSVERERLTRRLARQALDGVTIVVEGRAQALRDVRTKLDARSGRPLGVMVLGWIPCPSTPEVVVRNAPSARPITFMGVGTGFSRQVKPGTHQRWDGPRAADVRKRTAVPQ